MIVETLPVGALQCNCTILGDEQSRRALVIDPGDEVEAIAEILRRHNLTVAVIVATHAHIDHVGGLAALKDMTGAPAMLHEADVPLYEHMAEQAKWLGVATPPVTTLDGYLKDGLRIAFGGRAAEVIHTPGHSPGSCSFVVPERVPILFTGDTLFAGGIGRTDLWGGSFDEIIESIRKKLFEFGDDVIAVPGHGPKTSIGRERRTNPFLV